MNNLNDIDKKRKKAYKKKHTSLIFILFFFLFMILGGIFVILKEFFHVTSDQINYFVEGELPIVQLGMILIFLFLAILLINRPKLKGKAKKFNEYYAKHYLITQMKDFEVEWIGSANGFEKKALSKLFSYATLETLTYLVGTWKEFDFKLGEVIVSQEEWSHGTGDDSERNKVAHVGTLLTINLATHLSNPVTILSKNPRQPTLKVQADSLIKALKKFALKDLDQPIDFGNPAFSENFLVSGDEQDLAWINNRIQDCLNNLAVHFPQLFLQLERNDCLLFIERPDLLVPKNTQVTEDYMQQQKFLFHLLNQLLCALQA